MAGGMHCRGLCIVGACMVESMCGIEACMEEGRECR